MNKVKTLILVLGTTLGVSAFAFGGNGPCVPDGLVPGPQPGMLVGPHHGMQAPIFKDKAYAPDVEAIGKLERDLFVERQVLDSLKQKGEPNAIREQAGKVFDLQDQLDRSRFDLMEKVRKDHPEFKGPDPQRGPGHHDKDRRGGPRGQGPQGLQGPAPQGPAPQPAPQVEPPQQPAGK